MIKAASIFFNVRFLSHALEVLVFIIIKHGIKFVSKNLTSKAVQVMRHSRASYYKRSLVFTGKSTFKRAGKRNSKCYGVKVLGYSGESKKY